MLRALERVDVRDREVATSNHTGEMGQPKHAAQRELPHNDVVDYMDRESIGGCSTKVERMRSPSETLNHYIVPSRLGGGQLLTYHARPDTLRELLDRRSLTP